MVHWRRTYINHVISPYLTILPQPSSLFRSLMVSKRSKKSPSALAPAKTAAEVPATPSRSTAAEARSDSSPPLAADDPTPQSADDTLIPSAGAWKTGEQLEYMLSVWSVYLTHQDEGTLSKFWPRVFDHWQKTWKIVPSASDVKEYGGPQEAILVIRAKTNKVRISNLCSLDVTTTAYPSSVREYVRGSTTLLVLEPSSLLLRTPPPSRTYASTEPRNAGLPPFRHTVLMPGTLASAIRPSSGGKRRSSPFC